MRYKAWGVFVALASTVLLSLGTAGGQRQNEPPKNVAGIPVNYDESLVGSYTLPDPLVLSDGKRVRDAKTWYGKRRPEIVRLFEENQFGCSPGRPAGMSFDVFDRGTPALEGRALRRQVTVYFTRDKAGPKMDLLVYLPARVGRHRGLGLGPEPRARLLRDRPGRGREARRHRRRVAAGEDGALGGHGTIPSDWPLFLRFMQLPR